MGRIQLQASWSAGQVVVWAGGPGTVSTTNDDLADLLEAVGGPAVGWNLHPDVPLPSGARAEALSIPVRESLGWLVDVGSGSHGDQVGPSVLWLGRVALLAVRLVAAGAVVPTLRTARAADGRGQRGGGGLAAGTGRRGRARPAGRRHAGAGRRAGPGRRRGPRSWPCIDGRGRRHRQRGGRPVGAAGTTADDHEPTAAIAEAFTTRLDGSVVPGRRRGRPGRSPAGSRCGRSR